MRAAITLVLLLLAIVFVANVACQSPAGGGGNANAADTDADATTDPPVTDDDMDDGDGDPPFVDDDDDGMDDSDGGDDADDDDSDPDPGGDDVIEPFLPEDVSLDIGELPEDADTEVSKPLPEGQTARLMYERVVRSSATIIHRYHRMANRALALGASVRSDFTDPEQTQVRGTFLVEGQKIAYKADFAAFDFDSNGTPDGSGTATDLPIALRIWIDKGKGFERFLCALVTERPSEAHFGAGMFYVEPAAALPSDPIGVRIRVEYDRTDPAHKWNVAYVSGRIHPQHDLAIGLARVDVRGADVGSVEKTVRAAYQFTSNLYGFSTFQSAAHYLRGGTGLLLTGMSSGGLLQVSFEPICTSIETHSLAVDGECDSFDVQDMTLLDVPTGDETQFPGDFPELPTF